MTPHTPGPRGMSHCYPHNGYHHPFYCLCPSCPGCGLPVNGTKATWCGDCISQQAEMISNDMEDHNA